MGELFLYVLQRYIKEVITAKFDFTQLALYNIFIFVNFEMIVTLPRKK